MIILTCRMMWSVIVMLLKCLNIIVSFLGRHTLSLIRPVRRKRPKPRALDLDCGMFLTTENVPGENATIVMSVFGLIGFDDLV